MKRALAALTMVALVAAGCTNSPDRNNYPITPPSPSAAQCSEPLVKATPSPVALPARVADVNKEPLPNAKKLEAQFFTSIPGGPPKYIKSVLDLVVLENCIHSVIRIDPTPSSSDDPRQKSECARHLSERQSVLYCHDLKAFVFEESYVNAAFDDPEFGSLELIWQIMEAASDHKAALRGDRELRKCANADAYATLVLSGYMTIEQLGKITEAHRANYVWPNPDYNSSAQRIAMLQQALTTGFCK